MEIYCIEGKFVVDMDFERPNNSARFPSTLTGAHILDIYNNGSRDLASVRRDFPFFLCMFLHEKQ